MHRWLHQNRSEGCTSKAIDYACQYNHTQVVKWLIKNISNVGFSNNAIDWASKFGNIELLVILNEHDSHMRGSEKALEFAITLGHRHVVRYLIDKYGYVPTINTMQNAISNGYGDMVDLVKELIPPCDSPLQLELSIAIGLDRSEC